MKSTLRKPVILRLNPVTPFVVPINSSALDPLSEVVIILHGFTGSVTSRSVTLIRDALLYQHNITVIAVQWERLARGPYYDEAAGNTKLVAQYLFQFLLNLEAKGLNLSHVHIIGFSLGAHVAGFTGALLEGRVGRVTGLDPARPGFDSQNNNGRLDPGDAKFVVGIHTGAGLLAMSEPVGHVDFYPNGGSKQPFCYSDDVPLVCNHFMAYIYFTESIYNADAFPARRCSSWTEFESGHCDFNDELFMGYHIPNTARGLFFLRTNSEEPFGLGQAHHIVNLDINQTSPFSVVSVTDSLEQNETANGANRNHHKAVHSFGADVDNAGDLNVQDLNEKDSKSHVLNCSSTFHCASLPILLFFWSSLSLLL